MIGQVYVVDRPPLKNSAQTLTVDQTTGGIGITLPAGIRWDQVGGALITSDQASGVCRYTTDETDPTDSVGIEIQPSSGIFIGNAQGAMNFKAFAETGTNAVLQVQLF